jgi:hypothetical protein
MLRIMKMLPLLLRPDLRGALLLLSTALLTAAGDKPAPPEAQARAQLLHAAFDGTLRVMHRDFFRKGDNKAIPSASLNDVFNALAEEQGVQLRWLAGEETIMNVDHRPKDDFQKRALKAIAGGEKEFSAVEGGTLRYAGAIALKNECL